MSKILRPLLLFFMMPGAVIAQILPTEGSILNFRLIGCSVPPEKQATNYKFEIALGTWDSEDSFKRNIVAYANSGDNKFILEVPSFGSVYTWRTLVTTANKAAAKQAPLHHFSTSIIPEVDSNVTRLRILKPATKYAGDYVFLDGTKALYGMNGRPVWFLPDLEGITTPPIDLKLSPQNTGVTCLLDGKAYEINYYGTILWKTSWDSSGSSPGPDYYHHELTRMENGHYMLLGNEFIEWDHTQTGAKNSKTQPEHGILKTLFGTIVEYDEHGNIVWTWKSSKYFIGSDINYYVPKPGNHSIVDVHENSFYFDERDHAIYLGFKNISRILKISYPAGNVLNTYGEIYKPATPEKGNGLFCDQHSCKHSDKGYLYLYNNNNCSNDSIPFPRISVFRKPPAGKSKLEKLWEYQCTAEGLNMAKQLNIPQRDLHGRLLQQHQTSGGNVIELPDSSFFVSMSGPYCKVFIVNRDKKILWSALPERYNMEEHDWDPISQYRASIITRSQLEQFIWSSEIKK